MNLTAYTGGEPLRATPGGSRWPRPDRAYAVPSEGEYTISSHLLYFLTSNLSETSLRFLFARLFEEGFAETYLDLRAEVKNHNSSFCAVVTCW